VKSRHPNLKQSHWYKTGRCIPEGQNQDITLAGRHHSLTRLPSCSASNAVVVLAVAFIVALAAESITNITVGRRLLPAYLICFLPPFFIFLPPQPQPNPSSSASSPSIYIHSLLLQQQQQQQLIHLTSTTIYNNTFTSTMPQPNQKVERECSLCGKIRGIYEFSASQRRKGDDAACLRCIPEIQNVKPGHLKQDEDNSDAKYIAVSSDLS
jgi:hypothetical protein